MPNNQDRTGCAKRRRRHDGPNFIQLFRYMLNCPAYVSLSASARAALIEVTRGYNGGNNGRIGAFGARSRHALRLSPRYR